ncbi:MAG TPA: hypothetical protein VH280_04625 [Verrucomicrobiae bacterium]|jgi:hypothetical protein|nr:hypothetical protein [Verrucomicrobiae bacterium]
MSTQNKNIVRIAPDSWTASSQKLIVGIERTKRQLLAQSNEQLKLPQRLFQVALNEAEALAWETEYPQLVFPTLAEEKIAAMSFWYDGGGILRSDYAIAV